MSTPTPAVQPRFTFSTEPHGTGGFAKVIKGRDNTLERDIAIKVLDPLATTAFAEADQERFRREARCLARMSHPNIPAIYDVDLSPGRFLIVFQFIEGDTLRTIIDKQGPCPLSSVRLWFRQIASALEHAHELSIIHRDIKPENIIVRTDRESAYVVDFGIALSADEAKRLTGSGYAIGTPGYMSPEQAAGEAVDAGTDVYSLAVTLYEALAGKKIPVGHYEPLSSINEGIPPQIDDLIERCLTPKERRLTSMKEFAAQLSSALQPNKPLSDVLAHGRLHELAASIEQLTPSEFVQLPAGQRALILAKLSDIVESKEDRLEYATEQLLELMLTRGLLLEKDNYRDIVKPAIEWAFEIEFDDYLDASKTYLGKDRLRRALEKAAYAARGRAHEVLTEEMGAFVSKCKLDEREDWYLHSVREVLQSLLANPDCGPAPELVESLKRVNKIQRSRNARW